MLHRTADAGLGHVHQPRSARDRPRYHDRPDHFDLSQRQRHANPPPSPTACLPGSTPRRHAAIQSATATLARGQRRCRCRQDARKPTSAEAISVNGHSRPRWTNFRRNASARG
ncbi:hypothetical protein EKH55_4822 [Sinorhizobium alkalisoli]|nr:hypothetical protein EKH55_4822 [Sinorhizobium alkalisoli]